ncbi:TrmB family transcriptional regulator, partial [Streptomyces sp. SID5926]|nr:TrmB family transcriptional regulator [Streptomyces sp. SID5926]
MVLEIAGLSPDEESVYALLVAFGRAGAADLAERDGMPVERMDRVLESLTAKGLASPTDGVPRLYQAAPPDV